MSVSVFESDQQCVLSSLPPNTDTMEKVTWHVEKNHIRAGEKDTKKQNIIKQTFDLFHEK